MLFYPITFAEVLPVEAFAKLPDVQRVAISPDGKKIASLVRIDVPGLEGSVVAVFNLEKNQNKALVRSDNKKFTISGMRWGNNDTILVSARFPAVRYGTPTTETRLLKLDVNNADLDSVVTKRYLRRYDWIPQFQNTIVDSLPNDPDHILLGLDTKNPGDDRVYKINLNNGKQTTIQKNRTMFAPGSLTDSIGFALGYIRMTRPFAF